MTIQEAINRIDELKPGMFTDEQKIAWLSEVDGFVWNDIILTHAGKEPTLTYHGYDQTTERDTQLLVPAPYDKVYEHYLAARMADKNREMGEYAKEEAAYNAAWQTYTDYYGRIHMPISRVRCLRF